MSILKEEHRIVIDSGVITDAVESLISFFQLNGYELSSDASEDTDSVVLKRGERGAGWYSSEMTALFTELEVAVESESVVLRYTVDVKGQRLSQGDRAFWGREVKSAAAVVRDGAEAVDLRPEETKRVAGALRGFYLKGVVFTVLFVLFVLLLILLGIL